MAKYVDVEPLLEEQYEGFDRANETDWQKGYWAGIDEMCEKIKAQPSSDVVEVVHTSWETELDDMGWNKHTCPNCGFMKRTDIHISLEWNYCPNCGAKMERRWSK